MRTRQKTGRKERGAAAVELALLAPFLALLTVVAAEFGMLMANSMMVMNAASSGARFFASQRGVSTPYTDTARQIKASASYLSAAGVTYSTSVGNNACNADDACALSLNNAVKNGAVTNATVTVNYVYRPLTGLADILPKSLSATVVVRVL